MSAGSLACKWDEIPGLAVAFAPAGGRWNRPDAAKASASSPDCRPSGPAVSLLWEPDLRRPPGLLEAAFEGRNMGFFPTGK